MTITISDSEILDAKILTVSRDLTVITFDVQNGQRNTAELDFKILESNDGAALQITYAGPKNAKLEFHGAKKGARSPTINEVTGFSQKIFTPLEEALAKIANLVSVLFFGLVLSVLSAVIPFVRNFIYRKLFRSNKTDPEIEDSAMRLLIPAVVVLILLGFSLIATIPPKVTEVTGAIPKGAIPPALIVKDLIL